MITRIPILLYHSVSEAASPQFRRWAIQPKTFVEHMAYLHDQAYTPVTVTQFAQAMTDSARLPERPVVLTFDDGLADFTSALLTLEQYGFPATLYITTGYIGRKSCWLKSEGESERAMLTWAQVVEICARGVECGAHSHSHLQLDTLSPAQARDEITRCKVELEQHLGHAVESFAYPHGYYSSTVRRLVQQVGFSSACGVKHAMSAFTDDRFGLARIIVSADTDVKGLRRLLDGDGLPVAPAQERLRTAGWRIARRVAGIMRSRAFA